ncbi:MAG: hypothetical protein KBD44_02560 [Candidatus Pacebacteria bacterium]|nr:hypothetical protein [Candidatus Paceibacterota bacterium]
MIIDVAYLQAWLSLLMFQPESSPYEAAWREINALEESRSYDDGELSLLRKLARRWYHAAIHNQ